MTMTPTGDPQRRPPGRIGYAIIAGFFILAFILMLLVVLPNT